MDNILSNPIKLKPINLFIITSWFICWFSISFNPEIIKILLNKEFVIQDLFSFLNLIRGLSTIIIFPFLILILIFKGNNNVKTNFKDINIIFVLFGIFFFTQIFGTLETNNNKVNIYYLVNSLNTIIICYYIKNNFEESEKKFFFTITFFLIFLYFIYTATKYIHAYFLFENISFYHTWTKITQNENFKISRPTGLARIGLIIFIYSSINYLFNKKFQKFFLFFSIISTLLIFASSSRAIIIIYVCYILFFLFYFRLRIKYIYNILFKITIIPLLLVLVINGIDIKKINNLEIENSSTEKKQILRNFPDLKINKINEFSSGRLSIWKEILSKNENIILGNGVSGDRYLVSDTASNVLIYAYASLGLVGVLLIITISILTLQVTLNSLFSKLNNNNTNYVSCAILICLVLRSFFETSFGVFGIDLMVYCLCLSIIASKKISKI